MDKLENILIKRLYNLVGNVQCKDLPHDKSTFHNAGEVCPVELQVQEIFETLLTPKNND
jgi:hypothetical protein